MGTSMLFQRRTQALRCLCQYVQQNNVFINVELNASTTGAVGKGILPPVHATSMSKCV